MLGLVVDNIEQYSGVRNGVVVRSRYDHDVWLTSVLLVLYLPEVHKVRREDVGEHGSQSAMRLSFCWAMKVSFSVTIG